MPQKAAKLLSRRLPIAGLLLNISTDREHVFESILKWALRGFKWVREVFLQTLGIVRLKHPSGDLKHAR
jgi:hypothetical protein